MVAIAPTHTDRLRESIAPFLRFFTGPYAQLEPDPEVANFAVGNPQELAMPGYVAAVGRQLEPRDKDWYAYKLSEPQATRTVADSLSRLTGLDWDPADVQMTNGGFGAIAVALRTLLEPGDEALFQCPPWFFYEQLVLAAGGVPVRARLEPPDFEIPFDEIAARITPRTRVVLLNSPHNPSGRVYPLGDLRRLASLLEEQSTRIGRPIYLLSDEPYRRILFDGRNFHSPAEVYPHTVITYSYGKQLLAPGMRIGYLTWPPTMPDRERLRDDVFVQQCASGYMFPNADLQHALPELDPMVIDLAAMERRRDRFVGRLREIGYETTLPEGTFYVMVRSPVADDEAFAGMLGRHKVLVLPGSIVELPGWLRISLTASDEMVQRGLPGFEAAWAEATG
ncbi:MAG TPA: aminotransferase class I/II-fold pyridoxal phosphate-dependent enzyme [Candidatus Limnocylindrales bacterium]|nr:aminotransferase class I/II-fold pyridoxal phosphate-dependent enzyme [Candidatus Limnocylindrales bacterium]